MSLEDILLEFSTVVHGEVLMAVPRKRYDALAAELADWKRMRNEAMAQATFNRNEIDALAASVDRLTSDKARLAVENAKLRNEPLLPRSPLTEQVLRDRIRALEAAQGHCSIHGECPQCRANRIIGDPREIVILGSTVPETSGVKP